MSNKAYVLYVDHQGHPAPLSLCYHATASRRLASSLDTRSPPSTITETDSAYCPHCLSFHDAASAARLVVCPKPTCRRCPLCQSVASIATENNDCLYRCGRAQCGWTSRDCRLTVPVAVKEDGSVDRLVMSKAAEELHSSLQERITPGKNALQDYYQILADHWSHQHKQQQVPTSKASADRSSLWSVEALETALEEAKRKRYQSTDVTNPQQVQNIQFLSPQNDWKEEDNVVPDNLVDLPISSCLLQSCNSPAHSSKIRREDLLPLPVFLRVRTSRRCRAELQEGRPGIVLKPKLNPLEGDSSLRTGHGQWWKKDSSAVHVIPNVTIADQIPVDSKGCHLLLKVANPTLGSMRLRFATSSYQGEPDWDDPHQRNTHLSHLLVDTFQQTFVDVNIDKETLTTLSPTESVELQSAEDTIIELGGKARAIPEDVRNWRSTKEGSNMTAPESIAAMKLLVQSTSTAWFELFLPPDPAVDASIVTGRRAVPLALQIEIGNGSWESSLIKPASTDKKESNEVDRVTFDLVLVLGG